MKNLKVVSLALVLTLVLTSLLGCTATPAVSAQSNPSAQESASVAASPLAAESKTEPAKKVTIGMCPKFTSDPYFAAVNNGANEACKELGYELDFNGPVNADVAAQADIIDQWIQKKYTAITVSANDPDALSAPLQKAKDAGIFTSAFNADVTSGRELFLNQTTNEDMGKAWVGLMVKDSGVTEGKFLVVTAVLTAPNQNAWIDAMKKYIAEKYPKMVIDAVLPGDEDLAKSRDVALNYLRSHPDTKGVFCATGIAVPGVCEAVEQLGLTGKVTITGLGVPSLVSDYLKKGTLKSCCLWNPVDQGYAAIYMIKAQVDGKVKEVLEQGYLDAGRLGKLKVIDKEKGIILQGDPYVFTKDNVDNFQF